LLGRQRFSFLLLVLLVCFKISALSNTHHHGTDNSGDFSGVSPHSIVFEKADGCRRRTPPSTRSVQLYGSWDNFSAPYPMQRDARIGHEHWSGCHNFSNIICDGDVTGNVTPREGGLKMGGTYWYYVGGRSRYLGTLDLQIPHSIHWTTRSNSTTRLNHRRPRARCFPVSSSTF
jgi:hypothetical protein